MRLNLVNPTAKAYTEASPFVQMGPFSKVIDSELVGNNFVGDFACFNRCRVGRYTGLSFCSYAADSEIGRFTTIGSRVSIGAFSHPTDWLSIHEFQYRDVSRIYGETLIDGGRNLLSSTDRPTRLGNDVWVGDNAAIGRGVTIGDGAIIGLSAVVVSDVEPFSIVVGNPGRTLRKRFPDDIISALVDLKWWDSDLNHLHGINFKDIRSAIADLRTRQLRVADGN